MVAFLSVEVHHDPVDHIYLDDFSVTAAYRNKGIGSALICAAEAYAEQIGSRAVILHVEKQTHRQCAFMSGWDTLNTPDSEHLVGDE